MSYPIPKYSEKWPVYAKQWDGMSILPDNPRDPRPGRSAVMRDARKILANKARYQKIEEMTRNNGPLSGVPWYMIGALHMRESGGQFDKQLGQGWPLTSKSKWKPYTGPFKTFEDSALAALAADDKKFDKIIDWRLEKILYYSERYNGWGYYQFHNKMPSPYVWGATTAQVKGKYVSDGVWSSTVWDKQIGVAAMIKALMELDPSIKPARETPEDIVVKKAVATAVATADSSILAVQEPTPEQASPKTPDIQPLTKSRTMTGAVISGLAGAAGILGNVNWPMAIVLLAILAFGVYLVWSGRVNVQRVLEHLVAQGREEDE